MVLLGGSAWAQTTSRVSVDSNGNQGNDVCDLPDCVTSADGRYTAFSSRASNLVSGDTNGYCDVFVHDLQTGTTTIASVDSNDVQGNDDSWDPSISADGRYVVFSYPAELVPGYGFGVFLHDLQGGTTTIVSVSNGVVGYSYHESISGDGRYVAFESDADNLVPGDTNGLLDIFVHDLQTGTLTLVSTDSTGVPGNDWSLESSISGDGRYVAFASHASNLVPGDTNGCSDVFVHDLQTGTTTLVSVDPNGVQGDLLSEYPSISGDGRYVAFTSRSDNLVRGDTNQEEDAFVHDLQTGAVTLVSVDSNGLQGDSQTFFSAISGDGRRVAFGSRSDNLVAGDTNGVSDVFVHDRGPCSSPASWSNYGAGWPGTNGIPAFTASGNPVLCTTITIDLANSLGATTTAALFVGL
ncbi:MAG: calcium-binding protein, partial [Candidatus Eisenbacteria bacterium]